MARPPNPEPDSNVPQQSGAGFLARFGWMLIGPATAIISLLVIFQNRQGGFSSADAALWCVVFACIAVRYLDVSRLNGLTATGKPASLVDWRRYSLILLLVALVLWSIARWAALVGMFRR